MSVQCPFTDAMSLGEKGELDLDKANNDVCDRAPKQSTNFPSEDDFQRSNEPSLRRTIALLAIPLMVMWLRLISSSLFVSSRINLGRICANPHSARISPEDATAGGLFWRLTSLLSMLVGVVVASWSMEQFFPETERDTIEDVSGLVLYLEVTVVVLMDPDIISRLVCFWRGGDQLLLDFLEISIPVHLLVLFAILLRTRLYGGRAALRREIGSMGSNLSGALRTVIGRG